MITSREYYNEKKILYINDDSFCLLNENVQDWPFEETELELSNETNETLPDAKKRKNVLTSHKEFNLSQLSGLLHANNELPAVELLFGS